MTYRLIQWRRQNSCAIALANHFYPSFLRSLANWFLPHPSKSPGPSHFDIIFLTCFPGLPSTFGFQGYRYSWWKKIENRNDWVLGTWAAESGIHLRILTGKINKSNPENPSCVIITPTARNIWELGWIRVLTIKIEWQPFFQNGFFKFFRDKLPTGSWFIRQGPHLYLYFRSSFLLNCFPGSVHTFAFWDPP